MNNQLSISEINGIAILTENDKKIYSVGISTAGCAEIRMALDHPQRHIITTTIDPIGAEYVSLQVTAKGLSKQIEVKIENVIDPLPYPNGSFDYVYARLVLHYLSKQDLQIALGQLYRILRAQGKLFVVVRSVESQEAKSTHSTFNPITHLTTCCWNGSSYSRYFHSEESIKSAITSYAFSINHIRAYQEQLFTDFQRSTLSNQIDSVIEVLATK